MRQINTIEINMMEQSKTKSIRDFEQSIWLDFFDRHIMESGKLRKLINDDGVSGITSNPSIFESAISSSSDYDDDIAAASQKKFSSEKIFFAFAVKDKQHAADFLNPCMRQQEEKTDL
jgi:transaldolase